MKYSVITSSVDGTEAIAAQIGSRLRGGEFIELVGDLGAGKTTFTRGLAQGIGSSDRVASPTFTVSKVYQGKDIEIHHFDLYRLQDAGLMEYEISELAEQDDVVVVVEWADVASASLPAGRLVVSFSHQADESRKLDLEAPAELDYLVKNLNPN